MCVCLTIFNDYIRFFITITVRFLMISVEIECTESYICLRHNAMRKSFQQKWVNPNFIVRLTSHISVEIFFFRQKKKHNFAYNYALTEKKERREVLFLAFLANARSPPDRYNWGTIICTSRCVGFIG